MPKYRKDHKYVQQKTELELESTNEKVRMFKSTKLAYLVALVFLGLSIIFNTELVRPFGTDIGKLLKVIEYGFRGVLVIGFFFFGMICWGNLKELRGSVLGAKEILVLVIISLIQTVRNGYVFLAASVGVLVVFLYIWLMQVKIRNV